MNEASLELMAQLVEAIREIDTSLQQLKKEVASVAEKLENIFQYLPLAGRGI